MNFVFQLLILVLELNTNYCKNILKGLDWKFCLSTRGLSSGHLDLIKE